MHKSIPMQMSQAKCFIVFLFLFFSFFFIDRNGDVNGVERKEAKKLFIFSKLMATNLKFGLRGKIFRKRWN